MKPTLQDFKERFHDINKTEDIKKKIELINKLKAQDTSNLDTLERLNLSNNLLSLYSSLNLKKSLIEEYKSIIEYIQENNIKAKNDEILKELNFILWKYKWYVEELCYFPEYNIQTILEEISKLEKVYTQFNLKTDAVRTYLKFKVYVLLGNKKKAGKQHKALKTYPITSSSDCDACRTSNEILFLLLTNQIDKAIEVAEPIIKEEIYCNEVPAIPNSSLLVPCVKKTRYQLANHLYYKTISIIDENSEFIKEIAYHIYYHLITGNIELSKQIYLNNLEYAKHIENPLAQIYFSYAGTLISQQIEDTVPTLLKPKEFSETLKAFNKRNGNQLIEKEFHDIENLILKQSNHQTNDNKVQFSLPKNIEIGKTCNTTEGFEVYEGEDLNSLKISVSKEKLWEIFSNVVKNFKSRHSNLIIDISDYQRDEVKFPFPDPEDYKQKSYILDSDKPKQLLKLIEPYKELILNSPWIILTINTFTGDNHRGEKITINWYKELKVTYYAEYNNKYLDLLVEMSIPQKEKLLSVSDLVNNYNKAVWKNSEELREKTQQMINDLEGKGLYIRQQER